MSAALMRYFAALGKGKIILWCYLIWYIFFVVRYFEPIPTLWLTSLGLSGVIGFALLLSTRGPTNRLERWQVFRLFLMPFCVSSFAALVKGRGFVLVFSPRVLEDFAALGICAAFCIFVWITQVVTSVETETEKF